ncbi:MAG: 4Fe-4S dicluster domain-containing protein [Deltaproteobacteria bacterium]|nr:4Fe-4S dicluster domain-containing protein [Deltaproteobacteria bacterium]
MNQYVLLKTDLNRWVEMARKKYRVYAPERVQEDIFFAPLLGPPESEFLTGLAVLPYLPPKDLVFPQSEILFSYSREGEKIALTVPDQETEASVLLGIRSCDTVGISWMDKFFRENFNDTYYGRRRDNLITVTIACNRPIKNCFCVCCEGGPFLDPGKNSFDLQLIDMNDRYLVECNSDQGETLINLDPALFSAPPPDMEAMRNRLEEEARSMFLPEPTSYMGTAIRRITADSVPSEVWTELGERCFDDGGCTFVCPCCSCFGVGYLAHGSGGCHYRFWDSCDYSGFTREVSGHNPRGEKGERFKRRFFHKLSYQYVKKDGRIGCVGCGRCITACPGEVGMPTVVETIRRSDTGDSSKE